MRNTLRELVEAGRTLGPVVQKENELRLAEIVDTYSGDTPMLGERREASAEARELKRSASKMIAGASVLVGGWFAFSQLVPFAIQQAFQPLAVEHVRTSSTPPRSASCEHPLDWNAQVECGNQYMRAKKRFETQWAAEHGSGRGTSAAIVLEK